MTKTEASFCRREVGERERERERLERDTLTHTLTQTKLHVVDMADKTDRDQNTVDESSY